jgi:hypothetical protein
MASIFSASNLLVLPFGALMILLPRWRWKRSRAELQLRRPLGLWTSMPAQSNFVGAAAGGFVGNTYLPAGFSDVTHAGQRATTRFGFLAAGNLFREFASQMPGPTRAFFALIAR